MSENPLDDLWKLHKIDQALVEIRSRAAALDPGKRLMAEIESLKAREIEFETEFHRLSGELADLELKQKGLDEKIMRIDKDLYGGKIVNPREVEALQKEIAMLKNQRGDIDVRVLELWDLVPPAKKAFEEAKAAREAKEKELHEYQKKVHEEKHRLEEAFKQQSALRQTAASQVEPGLLARYEAIRAKHGGLGMSRIAKDGSCELCGTMQPRKTVEMAKEGRWVTCEACHRILYYLESVA